MDAAMRVCIDDKVAVVMNPLRQVLLVTPVEAKRLGGEASVRLCVNCSGDTSTGIGRILQKYLSVWLLRQAQDSM